eukprot:352225-Chlamydomonas_euryale.AAC.12
MPLHIEAQTHVCFGASQRGGRDLPQLGSFAPPAPPAPRHRRYTSARVPTCAHAHTPSASEGWVVPGTGQITTAEWRVDAAAEGGGSPSCSFAFFTRVFSTRACEPAAAVAAKQDKLTACVPARACRDQRPPPRSPSPAGPVRCWKLSQVTAHLLIALHRTHPRGRLRNGAEGRPRTARGGRRGSIRGSASLASSLASRLHPPILSCLSRAWNEAWKLPHPCHAMGGALTVLGRLMDGSRFGGCRVTVAGPGRACMSRSAHTASCLHASARCEAVPDMMAPIPNQAAPNAAVGARQPLIASSHIGSK